MIQYYVVIEPLNFTDMEQSFMLKVVIFIFMTQIISKVFEDQLNQFVS